MKIHKIYIKNINSLRGSWEIDLSNYAGLFVINGATGAGKTTILDAICLALYGQTPRVKNISTDKNDLFTINADECSAMIEFSINSKTYFAKWVQKRTRKNAKKPFSTVTRTLACGEKIIASGITEVNAKIVEILSMNFVQFTQIVLLAQGQFTAFMRASGADRAQIFANISQNLLYDKISEAVLNRFNDEKQKLRNLGVGSLQIVDFSQENDFRAEIKVLENQQFHIEEWQKLKVLIQKECELIKEKDKLIEEKIFFSNHEEPRLQKAEKAEILYPIYQVLQQLKANYSKIELQIENNKLEINKLQKIHNSFNYEELQKKEKDITNKIEIAREIEINNAKIKEQIQKIKNDILKINVEFHSKINVENRNLQELEQQYNCALQNKTLEEWNCELENAQNYKSWLDNQKEIQLINQTINELKIELERIKIIEKQRKFAETAQELTLIRQQLKVGMPCPVCGAIEHQLHHLTEALQYNLVADENADLILQLERQLMSLETKLENKLILNVNPPREINYEQFINDYNYMLKIRKEFYCAQYSFLENKINLLQKKINSDDRDYEKLKKEQFLIKENLEKQKKDFSKIEQNLIALNSAQNIFNRELKDKATEIDNCQLKFNQELIKYEFNSLECLLKNRLDSNLIQELKERKQNLVFLEKQNYEQLNNTNRIISQLKKELSVSSLDQNQIDNELKRIKKLDAERIERIGSLKEKIKQIQDEFQAQKEKLEQIKYQQNILSHWEQLNELIGMKGDKKRFSHFVHGITFEQMLFFANQQLKTIYPRYQLKRIADELDFLIIDFEQGNNLRTNKNLSGGESFIISLALSLGLAQLSGKNIQIESLFLDEGFGTLDSESLDVVLETLIKIEATGKMIGIISHVGELKERINNIIELIPQSGGFSLIKGKGIKQL